jgi:hypothetical protein
MVDGQALCFLQKKSAEAIVGAMEVMPSTLFPDEKSEQVKRLCADGSYHQQQWSLDEK